MKIYLYWIYYWFFTTCPSRKIIDLIQCPNQKHQLLADVVTIICTKDIVSG